jgi:hypothetical protein
VLRLQVEPDLYRGAVLLDVRYQVDSSRLAGNGSWQLTLRPPRLRDAILLGRARWQVDLPAGCMPICSRGDASLEQHWGWWGWLPAPRPALSHKELEQWLGAADVNAPAEEGEPSLVCWQATFGPLGLVQIPQRAWLLICSLTMLTLGLGLLLLPLPRLLLWLGLAGIGVAVAAVGIWFPEILPIMVYGCEPGVLVLALAVAVQWMLHRRYRRQVIFMPGFTRLKAGSSLQRASGSERARDPSTIDQPPKKRPSSIVSAEQ